MGKKQRLKQQKAAQASSSSHPAAEASSSPAAASPVLAASASPVAATPASASSVAATTSAAAPSAPKVDMNSLISAPNAARIVANPKKKKTNPKKKSAKKPIPSGYLEMLTTRMIRELDMNTLKSALKEAGFAIPKPKSTKKLPRAELMKDIAKRFKFQLGPTILKVRATYIIEKLAYKPLCHLRQVRNYWFRRALMMSMQPRNTADFAMDILELYYNELIGLMRLQKGFEENDKVALDFDAFITLLVEELDFFINKALAYQILPIGSITQFDIVSELLRDKDMYRFRGLIRVPDEVEQNLKQNILEWAESLGIVCTPERDVGQSAGPSGIQEEADIGGYLSKSED
ncbi:hypothetical protein CCACVL1_12003 [Corchorus capsularis]|uniref:Uncharacterized protein n=1 Tax=Corchorus capsularis TaxID=210143 RepID=A0A1R3IID2_COCAP|nr:hypothetical protein CCACVL1_12003 [Corchorus capsularis]